MSLYNWHKFTLSKKFETSKGDNKATIIKNLKAGFKEMELFKNGKLKTTTAEDFLNKL